MLTPTQIATFHHNGYLVMPGLIRGRELALLQEESARVVAAGEAKDGDRHLYHGEADGSEVYWRSEEMWRRHDIFRAVALHPQLLENIGQCIGEAFFPWNDSLVVKTPGGGPVHWHQDPPYGDPQRTRTTATPNFTTDIYLDASDPENGCVYAIPGHHLVGTVTLGDKSQQELFERCGAVPVVMQPGDVLFHAISTPHGSRANTSLRRRRTFYIHYLTQGIIEDCGYGQWKPGWTPQQHALLLEMTRSRSRLGLEPALGEHLRLSPEQGLLLNESLRARTPPRHWETLAGAIDNSTRGALQRLALHERAASTAAAF